MILEIKQFLEILPLKQTCLGTTKPLFKLEKNIEKNGDRICENRCRNKKERSKNSKCARSTKRRGMKNEFIDSLENFKMILQEKIYLNHMLDKQYNKIEINHL